MEKQSGFPPSPRKVNRRQASQKFKLLTGGRFREKLPNPHFAGGCFNPGGLCAGIVRAGATGDESPTPATPRQQQLSATPKSPNNGKSIAPSSRDAQTHQALAF